MKMYVRSSFFVDFRLIPWEVQLHMREFKRQVTALFQKRRTKRNLLSYQKESLLSIKRDENLLVVQCNKNLGPAIITHAAYVARAFKEHLDCQKTYRPLTATQAATHATNITGKLEVWIQKHSQHLDTHEKRFLEKKIKDNKNPWGTFYLTMKVHKSPWTTRPIVSGSGTLLEGLGIWVDSQLQKTLTKQKSYFKSSLELKQQLISLHLPSNARIFTADAVSMYTNISTSKAITAIAQYLHTRSSKFPGIPLEALIEALKLVMENNLFSFGDTHFHQIDGTAMGTPPAPPYATLFFAIHEETFLCPNHAIASLLIFYKRFIDDVFGVWIPGPTTEIDRKNWQDFKDTMNNWCGLKWEFSERTTVVDFMDLTVSINGNKLETTLYEKALNLYLYIPPHSAHPPGVLNGLVIGNIHRIFTLCSTETKIKELITMFYDRLIVRGYKDTDIRPLFETGIARMRDRIREETNPAPSLDEDPNTRVFFHIPFNPGDPKSHIYQKLWRNIVVKPDGKPAEALPNLVNDAGHYIGIDRMTVAYSRCQNLANTLSYRKLSTTGLQASSFLGLEDLAGH
jgi:hypothetical protein